MCGESARKRCGGCKARYYCGTGTCQQQDWTAGGHKTACKTALATVPAAGPVVAWGPPRLVQRVALSDLKPGEFSARFMNSSTPVVLTGHVPASVLEQFVSSGRLGALVGETPLQCRVYGQGHMAKTELWKERGYVPKLEYLSGPVYADWIQSGAARQQDAYVASCDIASSAAGIVLEPLFGRLMEATSLAVTHFGPSINVWWGPPGHREGLHCDITDGTLWQLGGLKRVLLFPPAQWSNLYPFPVGDETGKTSWAFCQASGVLPDVVRFPRLPEAMRQRAEVLLQPGDILYIPAGWAHEVSGEELAGVDHVVSVNRFYFTPMTRGTWFLPQETKEFLSQKMAAVKR